MMRDEKGRYVKGHAKSHEGTWKKGDVPWNKGLRYKSEKTRGEKNVHWKGESASYTTKHEWIRTQMGKATCCGMCGSTDRDYYEWANVDHKYSRVLTDYIPMCVPCHKKYDKKFKTKVPR